MCVEPAGAGGSNAPPVLRPEVHATQKAPQIIFVQK